MTAIAQGLSATKDPTSRLNAFSNFASGRLLDHIATFLSGEDQGVLAGTCATMRLGSRHFQTTYFVSAECASDSIGNERLRHFPRLERLVFRGPGHNNDVATEIARQIHAYLPRVKDLIFDHPRIGINWRGVHALIQASPNLERLESSYPSSFDPFSAVHEGSAIGESTFRLLQERSQFRALNSTRHHVLFERQDEGTLLTVECWPKLRSLSTRNFDFPFQIKRLHEQLPSLTAVDLRGATNDRGSNDTQLNGAMTALIEQYKGQLTRLELPSCKIEEANALSKNCSRLEVLHVNYPLDRETTLKLFSTPFPALRSFDVILSEKAFPNEKNLITFLTNAPLLEALSLRMGSVSFHLTFLPIFLSIVAAHAPRLRYLNASYCGIGPAAFVGEHHATWQGKEEQFKKVSAFMRNLEFLNLSHIHVCGDYLAKLASACPSLRLLNLSRAKGITVETVGELLHRCPRLEYLNLSDVNMEEEPNGVIRLERPNLKVFFPQLRVVETAAHQVGFSDYVFRKCGFPYLATP